LQATVNPKNNLAHCFCCDENTNNIDLMMLRGHDFLGAVRLLKNWLDQYRQDVGLPTQSATPPPSQDK
jgi:DNA primase